MRAKLVNESLNNPSLLNEYVLAENILNEKIDINTITDKTKKIGVLASMFLLFVSGKPETFNKKNIEKSPIIRNMADEKYLTNKEIFKGFNTLINNEKILPIISTKMDGFIDSVNNAVPGRLDTTKVDRYDKFDKDILAATDYLKNKGENPNADFIKAIMLIESGMKPVKNNLGYEGFPQTKKIWVDAVNKKYGTNLTIEGMYNVYEATQFIHYFTEMIKNNKHVNTLEDILIAYNWGLGNLIKYKNGKKKLPAQSENYIKMLKAMEKYFVSEV